MNTESVSLTYVLTTRNKLPYLREVLSRLTRSLRPDEEIVVVDAASTDGTVEYLAGLKEAGAIRHYLSEPDAGEGHGYNKGMLLARGELIKIHTDDDVYYYPGIAACKAFLLAHPEVEALGTGAGGTDWAGQGPGASAAADGWADAYRRWRETSRPFSFCCNGLMVRRSALPKIGLFSVRFVAVDVEYSLRLTGERHNLAWYTGICWVGNTNPHSQSVTKERTMKREMEVLSERYLGVRSGGVVASGKKTLKAAERWGRDTLRGLLGIRREKSWPFPANIPESYEKCDRWLAEINRSRKGEFLWIDRERAGKERP